MVLEYHTDGPIAYFTLNRPDKRNAITPEMMELLEARLMEFMENERLRVGIITGAGDKAFCAGADVNEWLPFVKQTKDRPWRIPRTMLRGLNMTKPLIAAVNGGAYGGGAEIALACDFRVASETASFTFPEPKLGILPRLGGTQRLPRLVGEGRALEILLTGQKLNAAQAKEIGLVNRVST
ncbi:MAG: enoyl-CoA hydratase/isomerase family protein, partial [Oscillospiraceae bacterium]